MSNPKNHSFSRMDTFLNKCQRAHAFDALIPEVKKNAILAKGSHVHDGLECLANLMIKEGMTALEAAEEVATNQPEGYLKEPEFANYMHRGAEVFQYIKPVVAEEWFELRIPDEVGQPKLVGKIDLRSSVVPGFDHNGLPATILKEAQCVLDHKTTGNPKNIKSHYEAKNSLQLRIYCMVTGARHAGFLYYLPTGPVRGVVVEFSDEDIELTRKYLQENMQVIDWRWMEAKRVSGCGNGAPEVHGFNLRPFSLSPTPGYGLCQAKYCRHWDQCLGRKDSD